MGKTRIFKFRAREEDFERMDLIGATWGISMSAAIRAGLVALSRQMGHEKEFPEDLMKHK